MLTQKMYTTVSGGQVLEVALVGSDVIVTTGLKSESTVVSAVGYILSFLLIDAC